MPNDNTTTIRPFVSALIDRFIPEHVRENHPKFVQFIQAYFEFLETTHRSAYFQNTLPEQRNIELQESIFLSRIENEIGLFVPKKYATSPRVFYRKITDLWKAKGSEEGIKLFFRLFLGKIVEIRLPWDNVFKPSDGRWITDKRVRVSIIRGNPNDFVNKRIIQLENFALALVTQVEKKEYEDGIIYELSLDINQIVGNFVPADRIIVDDLNIDLEAEVYDSITDIEVLKKGQGYSVGSKVQIENLSNVTFEGRVSSVDEFGGINEVIIVDHGAGSTPDHILSTKTEGFVFKNFIPFDYLADNIRNQDLGDSIDFNETVILFGQSYTSEIYFEEFYNTKFDFEIEPFSTIQSSPITDLKAITKDIAIRGSDIIGSGSTGNIVILDKNGFGAELKINYGAVVLKTQYYAGVQGQLSESIVLQDSNFYQKFSYEVISSLSIDQWLDPLKKTVHPAGIKPFSLIDIKNELLPRPEFILNQISSLLLDPTSPNIPFVFSSVFYKFTKVVSSKIVTFEEIEKDFIKPLENLIGVGSDEILAKRFTKRNDNFVKNKTKEIKKFTKIIEPKENYSDEDPYFSERYLRTATELVVFDLGILSRDRRRFESVDVILNENIIKDFIKSLNNDVEIETKTKKDFIKFIEESNDIELNEKVQNRIKKPIELKEVYTEEVYFEQKYAISQNEFFVTDFDIVTKDFTKSVTNSTIINTNTKKDFIKFIEPKPSYEVFVIDQGPKKRIEKPFKDNLGFDPNERIEKGFIKPLNNNVILDEVITKDFEKLFKNNLGFDPNERIEKEFEKGITLKEVYTEEVYFEQKYAISQNEFFVTDFDIVTKDFTKSVISNAVKINTSINITFH